MAESETFWKFAKMNGMIQKPKGYLVGTLLDGNPTIGSMKRELKHQGISKQTQNNQEGKLRRTWNKEPENGERGEILPDQRSNIEWLKGDCRPA